MSWHKPVLPALLIALILHPEVLQSIRAGYPNDTWHQLSLFARLGLTLIAFTASTALLFLSISKSRFLHQEIAPKLLKNSSKRQRALLSLLADLPATALLFIVGISIAPQIFYTYYLSFFPDLPVQWVLKPMSSVNEWLAHMDTELDQSMAQHATTILFWTLIFSTLLSGLFHGLLSSPCSTARSS